MYELEGSTNLSRGSLGPGSHDAISISTRGLCMHILMLRVLVPNLLGCKRQDGGPGRLLLVILLCC